MKKLSKKFKVDLIILVAGLIISLLPVYSATFNLLGDLNDNLPFQRINLPIQLTNPSSSNGPCTADDHMLEWGIPFAARTTSGSSSCPDLTYYPLGYLFNFLIYSFLIWLAYKMFSLLFLRLKK